MHNVKNNLIVENENLFRALVFSPVAILFIVFGGPFLMSSGLVLFKVIYVVLALYCSLSALAYAAYYTNELSAGATESFLNNTSLFKALVCAPLAVLFWSISMNSIESSGHMFFNVIYVLMALYFTLSTLAYAAFYTNDRYV